MSMMSRDEGWDWFFAAAERDKLRSQLDVVTAERDKLRSQLDVVTKERNAYRQSVSALEKDRDHREIEG